MVKFFPITLFLVLIAGCSRAEKSVVWPGDTLPGDYAGYPGLQAFIHTMQEKHGLDSAWLWQLFYPVKRNSTVLKKVHAPAEGISWARYRNIFITEERIVAGVAFWQQHRQLIREISSRYGIAPEYLVALVGVETYYGRNTGRQPILQSLTTLTFDFPKRSRFYYKELAEYLLLCREENLPAATLTGSYAGAMGIPQFIASSYRHYAVDYDGDGQRNLWQPADALASAANYLKEHGWQEGLPVATRAITGSRLPAADTVARKPRYTSDQLAAAGVKPAEDFAAGRLMFLQFDGAEGTEYWLGSRNFYVITRYNHSPKYALAVHQLARALRERYAPVDN